jgi:YD repeat-containing protein
MNKKIIGIILGILLITTAIQAVGTIETDQFPMKENLKNNNLIKQTSPGFFNPGFWFEQDILNAPDGETGDYFGTSVSTDGNYAVVGAEGDDVYGPWAGSVYIFKRTVNTWSFEEKLLAPDGESNDNFGYSVSLYGDRVLIGAFGDNSYAGSAYIFKRIGSTWLLEAKLYISGGAPPDVFGWSVSLFGDYALIGSPGDDSYQGSAYLFKRSGSTWVQQAKLSALDGSPSDEFGRSVSIYGDYALVGAWHDDNFKGSAYVFKRSGSSWSQQAKLTASDGEINDLFGEDLSLYDDYALISAQLDDDNGDNSGSAYIFKRDVSSWTQQAKLTASDGVDYDYFGRTVSLYDDCALIGAIGDDAEKGSAYVFKRSGTTWTEEEKLTASDGVSGDRFGFVSLYDGYALIGANYKNYHKGSAYVFNRIVPIPDIPILKWVNIRGGLLGFSVGLKNSGENTAYDVKWEMFVVDGFLVPKYDSGEIANLEPGEEERIPLKWKFGLGRSTIEFHCDYVMSIDGTREDLDVKTKQEWNDLGLLIAHTFPDGIQPKKDWKDIKYYNYTVSGTGKGVEFNYKNFLEWHNVRVLEYGTGDELYTAACKFTNGVGYLEEGWITRSDIENANAYWQIEEVDGK